MIDAHATNIGLSPVALRTRRILRDPPFLSRPAADLVVAAARDHLAALEGLSAVAPLEVIVRRVLGPTENRLRDALRRAGFVQ